MERIPDLFMILTAATVFSAVWLMLAFLMPDRSVRMFAAIIALVPVPTAVLYLAMFHGLGAPGVSSPWLDRGVHYIIADGVVIAIIATLAMFRK
jgi:hypothetical protein